MWQVLDYNSAIGDIARFAESMVLWIDYSSNYAIYNAAGVKYAQWNKTVASHSGAFTVVTSTNSGRSASHKYGVMNM